MILDCGHPEDAGLPATVQQKDGSYKVYDQKGIHALRSLDILLQYPGNQIF